MVDYSERDPNKNPFLAKTNAIEFANKLTGRDPKARGVFASRGQSTAQFERWLPNRNHEYFDTMARMYINVHNEKQRKRIKKQASAAADIVDVLVGWGENKGGLGYLDFLLHTSDHNFKEKMQVSEVLSDNYVAFFFGQEAPIFSYTGTVMNTYQDNWLVNLYKVFQYLGRGTKLASRGVSLQLRYDSFTFFGAMLNLSWRLIAGQETYAAFAFNFLVKKAVVEPVNMNVPYSLARQDLEHATSLQELQGALFGDEWFQENDDSEETAQADWGNWGDGTEFEYDPVSNDELDQYLLDSSSSVATVKGYEAKDYTADLIANFGKAG